MTENFENRLLDHEERIASIEKTISKAEKLLILIVGLQFPNLIESLSIAGVI
jgi:ABC-type Fe3+-citrate transport system substrate-binding protein